MAEFKYLTSIPLLWNRRYDNYYNRTVRIDLDVNTIKSNINEYENVMIRLTNVIRQTYDYSSEYNNSNSRITTDNNQFNVLATYSITIESKNGGIITYDSLVSINIPLYDKLNIAGMTFGTTYVQNIEENSKSLAINEMRDFHFNNEEQLKDLIVQSLKQNIVTTI